MSRKTILFLSLGILILFLTPDLVYWGVIDHFQTPLRYISGDTGLYVAQLNNVLNTGKPAGNPFFIENAYKFGRFFVFGTLFSFLPLAGKIPIEWWLIILRGLVPFFIFFVMAKFLRLFNIEQKLSYWLALIFTFFYGTISFKGGIGMVNWFLPLFILGLIWTIEFYKEEVKSLKKFLLFLFSLVFFSLHPIYFAIGISFSGILWLNILFKKHNLKTAGLFLIWIVAAVGVFTYVFFPLIYTSDQALSAATAGLAARNTMIATHFPFLFLYGLRYLLVLVISFWGWKIIVKDGGDNKWRTCWAVILALSLVSFIGLNSYVITGKYFLNDHFPVIEDFLIIPLSLLILFGPKLKINLFSKFLGLATLVVALMSMLVLWNYFNFKPVYFGRWVPQYVAYFSAGLILFWPSAREWLVAKRGKLILIFLIFVSVFYFIFMWYWDDKYWLTFHRQIQEYRPVINQLNKLPGGVVLSDQYIGDMVISNTKHKLYWFPAAMHDLVATEELFQRWERARTFLPKEPAFNDNAAVGSVYGTIDNKCREFKRYIYLGYLSKIGISEPEKKICDHSLFEKWPGMRSEADKYSKKIVSGSVFDPIYKIDYLIVDRNKDFVPLVLLNRYFKKIIDIGAVSIYLFKK